MTHPTITESKPPLPSLIAALGGVFIGTIIAMVLGIVLAAAGLISEQFLGKVYFPWMFRLALASWPVLTLVIAVVKRRSVENQNQDS